VPAGDRDRLEHLCRYVLRPPIAQERLELTSDGKVLLRLRRPWHDGTRAIRFEPTELLEKLASMITPKMGDGGFRPAFNAQLATDTESRVIVGVGLTENGTDYAQAAPMVDQIEQRTGAKLEELLVDGGFTSKEAVEDVTEKQVILYGPVPERKDTPDPFAIKPTDSEAVRRWKERMATEEAKRIYRERAATAETVNGDLRAWRSLDRFLVRGKRKALCVLLWNALTYNIMPSRGGWRSRRAC